MSYSVRYHAIEDHEFVTVGIVVIGEVETHAGREGLGGGE